MLFTLVSIIVVCFVLCLVSTSEVKEKEHDVQDGSSNTLCTGCVDGSSNDSTLESTGDTDECTPVRSTTHSACDNPVVEVTDSSVSTLEDRTIYLKRNTIEELTVLLSEVPYRVMPNKYGWSEVA